MVAHWNNSRRVDMSLHSDTLFWFRANQSLLFLLNAACLGKKQQIPIFKVFCLTRLGFEPTIYRTRGEHAKHYATDAVYKYIYSHVWNLQLHDFNDKKCLPFLDTWYATDQYFSKITSSYFYKCSCNPCLIHRVLTCILSICHFHSQYIESAK